MPDVPFLLGLRLLTKQLSSLWDLGSGSESVTGCRANIGSRNIMSRNRKKDRIATISLIASSVPIFFNLWFAKSVGAESGLGHPGHPPSSQDIHHETFEKVSSLPSRNVLFNSNLISSFPRLQQNSLIIEERSSGSVLLLLFSVHSPESLLRVSDYIPERPLVLFPFWSQEDRNFWHRDGIFHRLLSTYTLYSSHPDTDCERSIGAKTTRAVLIISTSYLKWQYRLSFFITLTFGKWHLIFFQMPTNLCNL